MSAGVDRAIALGNDLLARCRRHIAEADARPGELMTDVGFALGYVLAEFIAFAATDPEDVAEGVRVHSDFVRERALEILPEKIAARALLAASRKVH